MDKAVCRGWFFTWNNPDGLLDFSEWSAMVAAFFSFFSPEFFLEGSTWLFYSEEVGDSGTYHFQGCAWFKTEKSMKQVRSLMDNEAHVEPLRSVKKALEYCSKDESHVGGPYEYGVRPAQGKRNDLIALKSQIDAGCSMVSLYETHFGSMIRYKPALVEYRRLVTPPRNVKTRCFLFVGPPGAGKSTLMKHIASKLGSFYFVPEKKGSGLYFDDYDYQDVMILDEMDGARMSATFFNSLVDEHPCTLPVHGGAGHQMISRYIFIGSNYAPSFWWKKRSLSQQAQTIRRIDIVFKVGLRANPNPLGYSRQLNII